MHCVSLVTLFALLTPAFAGVYVRSDNWKGEDFLEAFTFEAIADPTHGRVNYVDKETALAKNLTFAECDTLVLRADDTTILDPNGPGRDSVRIRSVKTYTTHVAIFDIAHMPQGCGTWPAVWETDESNWPNGGEVDIVSPVLCSEDGLADRRTRLIVASIAVQVEGINDQSPNAMTLHTGANCTMPASRHMSGTATVNNCDVNTDGYTGCGVQAPTTDSYGPSFNSNGGGWYAMERTNEFIKVWFWPREGDSPDDIDSAVIDTDHHNWGTPTAYFPNTSCDLATHFDANNIIINLTFCGDWAGQDAIYSASGCPSTCVDYVNNNPTAFTDAYWEFNSVRVYERL